LKTGKNKGFTLLELIIVTAVILALSGGVMMHFRGANRRYLQNSSLTLQADLRYAQRRAMMEGRRVGIQFEPRHNRYHIITLNPATILRTVYLENGVELYSTTGSRLMFLPRGTASAGFRIIKHNYPYWQHITATVSGGRIHVFNITRTNEPGE